MVPKRDPRRWHDGAPSTLVRPMPLRFFLRRIAASLALASLAACISSATVVDGRATAKETAGKAIVIVSVSNDSNLPDASDEFVIDGGAAAAVKVKSAAGRLERAISNDFQGKVGHVYVLELAPGHHRFTSWSAFWRGNTTKAGPAMQPLEFDVARGEVVYLGNLHVHWVVEKAWVVNQPIPQTATAVVSDQAGVDIAIAERASPAITGRARVALLTLGPWRHAPAPRP